MRTIKFRCWFDNHMFRVVDIDFSYKRINLFAADIIHFKDGVLMQYTGLKDKNGKEIYEGDIILTQPLRDRPFSQKAKSKRLRGIVEYNIKCGKNFIGNPDEMKYWGAEWNVEIIDKKDYEKYCNYGWGIFFECEVIGNIYENPELLEIQN